VTSTDNVLSESEMYLSADDDTDILREGDQSKMTNGHADYELSGDTDSASEVDEEDKMADSYDSFKQFTSEVAKLVDSQDSQAAEDSNEGGEGQLKMPPQLGSPSKLDGGDYIRRGTSQRADTQTVMQSCIQSFYKLFCTLVTNKVLKDKNMADMLLSQLMRGGAANSTACQSLSDVLSKLPHTTSPESDADEVMKVKLPHVNAGLCEAFQFLCQLLVDFSCFPMYCTDHLKPIDGALSKGQVCFIFLKKNTRIKSFNPSF
jgi:hypothetical protein